MKRVNTSDLVPGMVTAEDVYNFNNQLILPRGIILTDSTITKLAFYSVLTLYVEDQLVVQSAQTIIPPPIQTGSSAVPNLPDSTKNLKMTWIPSVAQ